jgi:hypothetical protein
LGGFLLGDLPLGGLPLGGLPLDGLPLGGLSSPIRINCEGKKEKDTADEVSANIDAYWSISYKRSSWGVQEGRRRPQAARHAGGTSLLANHP